jgi:CO/xanthine dehydrogenase FAD-binding subunit
MIKVKKYFQPTTIEEAYSILKENSEYKIVSGATSFVFSKNATYEGLVDITKLNFRMISRDDKYIHIGALCTINELIKNEITNSICNNIFVKVCKTLSNELTRNLCTIGGNILKPFWWSDLPALLVMLNAKAVIYFDHKYHVIELSDIYYKKAKLTNDDILIDIFFPIPDETYEYSYETLLKTKTDFAICSAYVAKKVEDNKIKDIKIYVSAIEALPKRMENLEKALLNLEISDKNFENAYKESDTFEPVRDFRVSNEYKLDVIKELIKRTIIK